MSASKVRGETRAVLDAVRRIVRALRRSATTAARSSQVPASQLFVLHALAAAGRLTVNELAERTYTDQSTVSVVASRLVELGLVSRQRSRIDRRSVLLGLTSRGRARLRKAAPSAPQEQLVEAVARLGAPARARLVRSLDELVAAMGLTHDPAPMLFEDGAARPPTRRRARRK